MVRAPDGTVSTPALPAFGAPVDPSIGTLGGVGGANTAASRRLSAVYARCSGASTSRGCDVYAYDLTRGTERKVDALARRGVQERAPSVNLGTWVLARNGAGVTGTWSYSTHRGVRRLSRYPAVETAASPARVAYTLDTEYGWSVHIRQPSGRGRPLIASSGGLERPWSPRVTRYRAGWLEPGTAATRVVLTERYAGSGGPYTLRVGAAARTLPAGVTSGAGDADTLFTRYLGGDGVRRIDPTIR